MTVPPSETTPTPENKSPEAPITPAPITPIETPKPAVSITSSGADSVIIMQDPLIDESRLRSFDDPFTPMPPLRLAAQDVIRPDNTADGALLRQFVTPARLRDLWTQLEALQEDVIKNVRADRTNTDAYQKDLLYANSLLLQSPANYDEARQVVYRVRADLQRERRVQADIAIYRPRIQLYYIIVFLLTFLAFFLDPYFRQAVPETLPILKLAWLPVLFAIFGALFNGAMALHEHTTMRSDFDPKHISWYVLNPFMGGMLGLVVFVFFVVIGTSFTPALPTDPKMAEAQTPIIWLLAFVVGWQQNIIFRLLNRFLKTFVTEPRPAARGSETPAPTANSAPPPTQQPKG